jgi:hypothetical protein
MISSQSSATRRDDYLSQEEDPNKSSGTLWVGARDGLPYRLTDNDPNGSTTSMNFDYTTPIKIEPPIP